MSLNWKNKILSHQEPPPEHLWDGISKKLDEGAATDDVPAFAKKLLDHEELPPAMAWDNINAALDQAETPKIIPINRRKIYWGLAAAAAIALIITTATWHTNSSDPVRDFTTAQLPVKKEASPASTTAETTPVAEKSQHPATIAKQGTANNKYTVNNSNNTDVAVTDIIINPVTTVETAPLAGNPFTNNREKLTNNAGDYAINTDLISTPGNYVMITGPDGNSRRVSTKISQYLGYINDKSPATEEAIDVIIREAPLWKGKLKNWSNKLIETPSTPTLYNFMNLIELSNLLSEKK